MTAKKKAAPGRREARKKTPATAGLVQLKRINLTVDLSASGARGALDTLRKVLAWRDGTGPTTQLRLNARDLNVVYLYLDVAQMKSLVARLVALVELAPS